MKTIFLPLVLTFLLISCHSQDREEPGRDFTQYVDPNIGTMHSRWFFYTPAAKPFGMAKVAPSTNGSYGNNNGWEAVGYDERHTSIEGFPNFHEFQIGGITFAPTVGELQTVPGVLEDTSTGYRSGFDREEEFATAGYYTVLLKDYDIQVELTATERVGFHRYTFPESQQSNIIFDIGRRMGESGSVVDASVQMIDEKHIAGFVITYPEYVKKYQSDASLKMYFYAELDKVPHAFGTFINDNITAGKKKKEGLVQVCILPIIPKLMKQSI